MYSSRENRTKKVNTGLIFIHVFFILFSAMFILPFLYVISISLSNESAISNFGYHLIPKQFDLAAYKYVFSNPQQIIDAYQVTAFISVVSMILSLTVTSLVAYPLSRKNFVIRKQLSLFIFFTSLFSGGLIPTYILVTQYLKLGNSIWVYIVCGLANAYTILVIKTFFQDIPESLIESAKIDGASEFRILFQLVIPLSKPGLATMALFAILSKWNEWAMTLLYITDAKLYTLQYLLQRILRDADFIRNIARQMPIGIDASVNTDVPIETMKFAMCVVASGPMLVIFPFFQKYFARGLTIGAIKG